MTIYYHPSLCRGLRILECTTILEHSAVLWGDSSKCGGFKTVRVVFRTYHTDKLVAGNKHLVTYSGQGILFPSHSYLNILVHFSSSSSSCIATPIDPACIYGAHLAPGWYIPRLTHHNHLIFVSLELGLLAPTMPSSQKNEMCLSKRYVFRLLRLDAAL
jgi:hypothetical protein